MKMFVNNFFWFVILAACITMTACNNPIGLGSTVDTSAPVIKIIAESDNAAVPGGFITGTKTIYINATDDSGIESVTVTYTYYVYNAEGKLVEKIEPNAPAYWDEETGCYTFDIDTVKNEMADGTLRAVVTVTDPSGKKTTTSELVYTVKNTSPVLTMQIPRPLVDPNDPQALIENRSPEVLTNSYLMGTYEDLAGVAAGYPRIKFWRNGDPEPSAYDQNAGWENVGYYADDPGGGWVYADEGMVESEKGERGGSFRYYLRERKSDGKPEDGNDGNSPLPPGYYNLKVQAVDINGLVREWPVDAFSNQPEYLTVLLYKQTQAGLPPEITVISPPSNRTNLFFNTNFYIKAAAAVRGEEQDIAEMVFEVTGKNNKRVVLRKWIGDETGSGVQASFAIELGKTYYCPTAGANAIQVENESEVPAGAFSHVTFADGNFSFIISARDYTGLDAIYPLSIYIDRQPPVTTITGVSPYVRVDDVVLTDHDSYRRWTTNGAVEIGVSSSDSRGNALDEKNGYMKFKYVFAKDNDIYEDDFTNWKGTNPSGTFGEFLYAHSDAVFFDKKNTDAANYIDVTGADGMYTLTLRTREYPEASDEYRLWFYIVSMDNAGNISYDKTLLYVNQDTDPPEIVVSLTDQAGVAIVRDNDLSDPFILPRKEGSYRKLDFVYGDLIERNLESVTVKIDSDAGKKAEFTVPASIPTLTSGEPAGADFSVWKTVGNNWNGELRWRVPLAEIFDGLEDGSHTFEITFVDKLSQTAAKTLAFFKDSGGPNVSLIVPGRKIYLSDADWNAVKRNEIESIPGLPAKIADIGVYNTIADTSGKLIGNFTDNLSPVFSSGNNGYWYRLESEDALIAAGWEWAAVSDITDSKTAAWQIPLPADMDDGFYRLSFRVKDSIGNGYDNTDTLAGQHGGPGFENNLALLLDRGIPQLSVTSPNPWPEFLNAGLIIKGQITGVRAVSGLSVSLNGKPLYEYAGANTDKIVVENANVKEAHNYTVNIPASVFTEGPNAIVITAIGASGQSAALARNFTFDKTAPSALFNAPGAGIKWAEGSLSNGKYEIYRSGIWVTGQPKIGGTSDDKNGVCKIFYHLGKLNDDAAPNDSAREIIYNAVDWTDTRLDTDNPHSSWSGGLYYWNFCENLNAYQFNPAFIEKSGAGLDTISANANQFYLPLYIKALDRAGNARVVQYKIFVDPDMDIPQAHIVSPAENALVGGEVRISGTANDNNWVHSVEIRIADTGKSPSAFDYYYKNDADEWAYPGALTPESGKGWVKAKIMGNTDMMVNWYYSVNGDGKLNPPAGALRPVKIEVRAIDTKDPAHLEPGLTGSSVSMLINFDSGVPTISIPLIKKTGSPEREYADGIRVSGNFQVSAVVKDEGGISSVRARISGSSQFTEIVKDGLVIQGNLPGGWIVDAPPEEYLDKWQTGWRYYITDPLSVTNTGWQAIDDSWTQGKRYEHGTMIHYKGGSISGTAKGIKANGKAGIQNDWNSQYFEYSLVFDINSTVIQGLGYGKTGNFTLELQAYDNNQTPGPYNTNGTYTLGVDNFYPTTKITTQYDSATRNFYVTGTAKDYDNQSGSIQGLERMLVYFEKDGIFYNPRGRSPGDTDSFYQAGGGGYAHSSEWATIPAMTNRPNVRDMSQSAPGYDPNVTNFSNFPALALRVKGGNTGDVWESPHAMVIDGQELGATTDADGDGTFAEMWDGRVDKQWQARLDTTLFPDGPLIVHYIVMDQAGNATHYQENIYIGNNRPMIRDFNLGTDINGSGSVEYMRNSLTVTSIKNNGEVKETISNEINTGFKIRNNRFDMKLNTLFGNTRKHYRVYYVDESTRREVGPAAMEKGAVYAIIDDGNTDWTRYGAPNRNIGTVFVASGRAETTNASEGKAVTYDCGAEVSGSFTTHHVGTGDEAVITFDDFTNMPDSPNKQYDDGGNMILMRDKRFIIKVYDTTVPGKPLDETLQLAHAALINVDFDNTDTRPPSIDVADFGREFVLRESKPNNPADIPVMANNADRVSAPIGAYAKNIVTTASGAKKGYAQYARHASAADGSRPSVSGMVIFKGKAADNGRIAKITAAIPGYNGGNGAGKPFDIAEWDGSALAPAIGANTVAAMRSGDAVEWGFETEHPNLTLDYGHVCNWNFAWDTSTVNGTVGNNVNITFTAHDAAGIASDPVTVSVNIVPYITEIVTPLSSAFSVNPSAFNRSAQGGYPVREGDSITIKGFNLAESASIKPTVTVNGTGLINADRVTVNSKNLLTVIIDNNNNNSDANTIVSGPLAVTVGAVTSLNNRNNNGADYNREPNNLNNNTLNDDRRLYVWNTGYLLNTRVVQSPFMRMDKNANRYMSYGTYDGRGHLNVRKNNANLDAESYNNRYLNTTVAFDAYGDWYTAGSNMTAFAQSSFVLVARAASGGDNGVAGANKRIIMRITNAAGTSDPNRVKIPRVFVQHTRPANNQGAQQQGDNNNADRIFMSYYDGNNAADNNPVFFKYGTIGANNYFGGDLTNQNATANPVAVQTVANDNQTHKGGVYTAVGGLSNGLPVIAWYDRTNQNLVFSYGSGTPTSNIYNNAGAIVTTTTAQWQANAVVVASFAGTHVDMAVDRDDNVHLAYYNVQDGGLHYAYIPSNGAAQAADVRPDTNAVQTARVDTYLSAGTKLMLNVRREGTRNVPYISYYHASFAETGKAIRVAWRTDFTDPAIPPNGTYADDSFTGAWEVMTVPTQTVPLADEFVTHGVPETAAGWVNPGGTLTTTGTGIAINKTVMVGYMTTDWYEGAILKDDLY